MYMLLSAFFRYHIIYLLYQFSSYSISYLLTFLTSPSWMNRYFKYENIYNIPKNSGNSNFKSVSI